MSNPSVLPADLHRQSLPLPVHHQPLSKKLRGRKVQHAAPVCLQSMRTNCWTALTKLYLSLPSGL